MKLFIIEFFYLKNKNQTKTFLCIYESENKARYHAKQLGKIKILKVEQIEL